MVFAIGAATSAALDLISSLQSTKSSSSAKASSNQSAFSLSGTGATTSSSQTAGSGAVNGLSPATFSALLAAQNPSTSSASSSTSTASDPLKNLFAQIDGDGDGKITKSEFETKLGAGGTNTANADSVFAKLDVNGDGSVSLDELSAALQSKSSSHRRHGAGKTGGSQQDALLQALDAADQSRAANKASSSYNLVDQLVSKQSQALAASAQQSLSIKI